MTKDDTYPDSSLFKINDDYYILENSHLRKFSSIKAFLSQYDLRQVIEKKEVKEKNG